MPGQSLSQVRALLDDAGISPLKRFGQNFLIDLNLLEKVAAASDLRPSDVVLEVGPGTGSLTERLLESGCRVVAVEIDRGLQQILRERLDRHPRFQLVGADVLAGKHAINPHVLDTLRATVPEPGGAYKLVANLPYQVATPLIAELLLGPLPLERMAVTIQLEVAEKLLAPPDTPAYGPLAVVLNLIADVALVTRLPPRAFWPRPQVESALLLVKPDARHDWPCADAAGFLGFVQQGFQQRRKMIRAAAHRWAVAPERLAAALTAVGVSDRMRPAELHPTHWLQLWEALRAT